MRPFPSVRVLACTFAVCAPFAVSAASGLPIGQAGEEAGAPAGQKGTGTATGASADRDRGVLAGPRVSETAADGTGGFAGGGMSANKQGDRRDQVPPRAWFRVLRGLDLDPVQRDAVQAVAREFQEKAREFQEANGPAVRELQEQAEKLGPGAGKELRSKMQELRNKAPKAEAYMERIWKMLTPEQQADFKARLDAVRPRQSRGDAMQPGDAGKPGDAMQPGDAMTPDDAMNPTGAGAPEGPRQPRTRPRGTPPRSRPRSGGPV